MLSSTLVLSKFEADESYFGAKRVRGKLGRGAKGKVLFVRLLKREGKVYTNIVRNCLKAELMPVIGHITRSKVQYIQIAGRAMIV